MSASVGTLHSRQVLRALGIFAVFAVLAFEIYSFLPTISGFWHPYDYGRYVEIGGRLIQDPYAYGKVPLDSVYPLPFELVFFVPLALLPDWFKFIWSFGPFVSLLFLFRRQIVIWFFYAPAWQVAFDGSIDGWFLIPIVWILENRPVYAALGALFLLVKPQVTIFLILFVLVRWLLKRDWKNLGVLAMGGVILSIPAFVLDPLWIWHMIVSLPARVNDPLSEVHLRWTTLWWGVWHGLFGYVLVALLLALMVFSFWRVWHAKKYLAEALQLVNLLTVFLLYVTSLVTVPPLVKTRRAAVWVVGLSIIAFTIYSIFWPFSGVYTLVPLAALYFLGDPQKA